MDYQQNPNEPQNQSEQQDSNIMQNSGGQQALNEQQAHGGQQTPNEQPAPVGQQMYNGQQTPGNNLNNSGNPYNNGNSYNNGNPYSNGYPYSNGNSYNNGYPYNNYNNRSPYNYNNGNPYNNGNAYNYNAYQQSYVITQKGDTLATASMVTGIIAVVSPMLIIVFPFALYFPFIFGGISIILALLSKGAAAKMISKAKSGIICATIGLVCNIALICTSFYLVFNNAEFRQSFDDAFIEMYGMTFEEVMEEIMEGENPYGY